jgi:glucose-6-phosphate 1-dehydrogenase
MTNRRLVIRIQPKEKYQPVIDGQVRGADREEIHCTYPIRYRDARCFQRERINGIAYERLLLDDRGEITEPIRPA